MTRLGGGLWKVILSSSNPRGLRKQLFLCVLAAHKKVVTCIIAPPTLSLVPEGTSHPKWCGSPQSTRPPAYNHHSLTLAAEPWFYPLCRRTEGVLLRV